jgi:hypothetical protein
VLKNVVAKAKAMVLLGFTASFSFTKFACLDRRTSACQQ